MEEEITKTAESPEEQKTDTGEELGRLKEKVSELENTAFDKERQISGLEQALTEAEKRQTEVSGRLSKAVASYKTLISAANTQIPAELLDGSSIEEIDESLQKAKALVGKIKQGVEAEMLSIQIPGGAPVRTAIKIEGLSPGEKIRYAIGENK